MGHCANGQQINLGNLRSSRGCGVLPEREYHYYEDTDKQVNR
jgi:hypothetical protein